MRGGGSNWRGWFKCWTWEGKGELPKLNNLFIYSFNLFIYFYLFNNLFKVDKFTKIQYTYIHKSSQTNWLIKVNYPILQKKSSDLSDKNKRKRKQSKNRFVTYHKINYTKPTWKAFVRHRRQGQFNGFHFLIALLKEATELRIDILNLNRNKLPDFRC